MHRKKKRGKDEECCKRGRQGEKKDRKQARRNLRKGGKREQERAVNVIEVYYAHVTGFCSAKVRVALETSTQLKVYVP